ncbi:PREDICTED: uncharacterized protein LOC104595788 [Nelumbo nucifera]|uniref:Uncharacterized protein n=2 Tax=Nelumbo nucifera TaxID=4432 RepID=A0A822Z2I1_NELNU|nr:PREDICTED: uncharacterized protein LOC104595788 [Nelumbo nucifera]DAD40624.1 TPA_asm: hypothetical protein HUJ06_014947 [Nelumbo nucifera]
MNSSCAAGCLDDAQPPIKISFMKLYQWPQADAEFLKLISMNEQNSSSGRRSVHDSFISRQRYLRSYTFCKNETVADKTKKWVKAKEKMKRKAKDRRSAGTSSCSVFEVVFKLLFSCVVKVDVLEF